MIQTGYIWEKNCNKSNSNEIYQVENNTKSLEEDFI